jgi:hypothetical protein
LGSFHAALVAFMVLIVVLGVLIFAAASFIGKIPWDKAESAQ